VTLSWTQFIVAVALLTLLTLAAVAWLALQPEPMSLSDSDSTRYY